MSSAVVPGRFSFSPGDVISGTQYRVDKHLGEGSYGDVYKVKDRDGRAWAIKFLRLWDVPSSIRQPLIDRFEMEFQTGRINSKYLVHSTDYGYYDGNPYIVMEFCPNGDLSSKVGRQDTDSPNYAREVLFGLHDLHVNGKVHRDLKPENVLIKDDGVAALTDFGISGDRNKRMTERSIFGRPNQIFGTYAYMPPEQVNRARGESTVLPTTDIFSFGVVAYQLVTGVLPFGKLDDQNDLVYYQKRAKSGDWDKTSLLRTAHGSEWVDAIEGCLVPDYKHRLQNTDAVLKYIPTYTAPRSVHREAIPRSSRPVNGHMSLRITQGEEFGRQYDLQEILSSKGTRVITVGRAESNDIQLKEFSEFYTSRRHFTIEKVGDGIWAVRDGQWNSLERRWDPSSNGTYVNSSEVTSDSFYVYDGDIVTAGDVKMKFEII